MTRRRSKHRVGRPARTARAQMFASYGDVCVVCGHDGAREAAHITALAVDPHQPITPHGMRPAHGSNARCPTCRRACNQEEGTALLGSSFRPVLTW